MQQYKQDFIEFLVKSKVLKFGDFTLKSGRKCPYFLNFGDIHSGEAIAELGKYYAHAINENVKDFDVLFGPAYKGIPISVGTSIAMYKELGRNVDYSFNRKEAKAHGEGGFLVGAKITGDSNVVILDDVMTAGTALRESLALLSTLGDPTVVAVVLGCDRMERGQGDKSAVQEVKGEFGIDVYAVVNLAEIVEYLHGREIEGQVVLGDEEVAKITAYREEYGV